MPISIAASSRARTNSAPIDTADLTLVPDMEISVPIGVNLTSLGASETEVPGEDTADPYLQQLNMPLLTSSVTAAYKGGIDVITLDSDFHVQPGAPMISTALDGVTIAAKLANWPGRTPQICAEVPSDPVYIRQAVELLANEQAQHVAVMCTLQELDDYQDFERAAQEARAAGVKLWLQAINPAITGSHADVVAKIFDAVRLRSADRRGARAMRFALREAAAQEQCDMRVYADIGIVISATLQAAEERAILLSQLNGAELFANFDAVVGTVYDVADIIELLVGMGAADGVILNPASLPTDLASILKGVLPLLAARATIERAE